VRDGGFEMQAGATITRHALRVTRHTSHTSHVTQAGATNFLAVLQSMFPRLKLPQACVMRNCSKEQLQQVRAPEATRSP